MVSSDYNTETINQQENCKKPKQMEAKQYATK